MSDSRTVLDSAITSAWRAGLWMRDKAKKHRLLMGLEPIALRVAGSIVPPPKTETEVTLVTGAVMCIPPGYPVARSYAANSYEPSLTALFTALVRPEMTVVDVGANIGYYTLLASNIVGLRGAVHSFEPDPLNYEYLIRNVTSNRSNNVRAMNQALSDQSGRVPFARDPNGAEGHLGVDGEPSSTIVDVTTIDDYFSATDTSRIDLIKVDVEGHEPEVLRGSVATCKRNAAIRLIIELNSDLLRRPGRKQALSEALADLGFSRGRIIESHVEFPVTAGIPDLSGTYNCLFEK